MENLRPERIRGLFVPALLLLIFLSPFPSFTQSSDDEKRLRQLFLKGCQHMEITPSPTPTPKPTPPPPPSHTHRASTLTSESTVRRATNAEATWVPRAPARQTAKETETSRSRATKPPAIAAESAASPSPQPREEEIARVTPTPKPKKRHGWWIFARHDEENGQIATQKSGSQEAAEAVSAPAPQGPGLHRYLTPAVRKAIDSSVSEPDAQQVHEVLLKMLDRWNAHDIEGHLEAYSKSPELLVVIDSEEFNGWQQLHDSYIHEYPDRNAMGFIQPKRIQVKLLKPDLALALALCSFSFPSSKRKAVGNTTMDLQKFADGWKIVASHTSIAEM